MIRIARTLALFLLSVVAAPLDLQAQNPPAQNTDDPLRFDTAVIVVAAKEPEDKQKLPLSVTAVTANNLDRMGVAIPSDASILAPNTLYTEFTARKLSSARFRGIGGSQNIPGITTFIDGVPQFNTNSSSLELIATDQIEFVRGPQSALFGKNTLGGLVNVTSARPAQDKWGGSASVPFGNFGAWSVRGAASGPVVDGKLSLGVAFAQVERDGFTVNDINGEDVDFRSGTSFKGQALWTPSANWEARFIVSNERARDGDYALNDYEALKATPFHVMRDFTGRTDRDVFNTTIQATHRGSQFVLTTTTGFVDWRTDDVTDLDYSPLPLVTRENTEENFQFTQEVRFASAKPTSLNLGGQTSLKWQAGVFFFSNNYDQDATNHLSAGVFPGVPIPVDLHAPALLDDDGIGLFGSGTFTIGERFDVTAGLRFDYESKSAVLNPSTEPAFGPTVPLRGEDTYSNVSPQFAAAYHFQPNSMVYGSVNRGFKAGGFNPQAPSGGHLPFDEEFSWHYEGGVKSVWLDSRILTNVAVFFIDWDNLQTFVPNPQDPSNFLIDNVGSATSTGVEFEVQTRPVQGLDVFAAVGFTSGEYGDDAVAGGFPVANNDLMLTPDYTASIGVQYTHRVGNTNVFGRADIANYGKFFYDESNVLSQGAYSLTNLRGGVTFRQIIVEAFLRNAFDERYIPVLFPYQFAPSGFIGEVGAPRTFGVNLGARF